MVRCFGCAVWLSRYGGGFGIFVMGFSVLFAFAGGLNVLLLGLGRHSSFVCCVNMSLNNAGVTINLLGRGFRVVTGGGYLALSGHSVDLIVSSVTSLYGRLVDRGGLARGSVRCVNVSAPNTMDPRSNIILCSGGLLVIGCPVTGRLSSHVNVRGVVVRGSTGTTTLNRTLVNTNGNGSDIVVVALNANINNNVILGHRVCSNFGSTNNRLKRVMVGASNERYAYNEHNY